MKSRTPEQELTDRKVGMNLRRARNMAGLSQRALAGQIGMSLGAIQHYEAADTRIPGSRLAVLARALGKPVDWFFSG